MAKTSADTRKKPGFFRRNFNLRRWAGYDLWAANAQHWFQYARSLFSKRMPVNHETFEEAMHRLGLTEADLTQRQREFFRLASTFAVIGLALFTYAIYLLFEKFSLAATLLTVVMSAVAFSQAFRFHFWYFQVKQRRLGCSISEWFNGRLRG